MKRFRNPPKTPLKSSPIEKDPVGVYCRLRPMENASDISCMKVISPSTIQLLTPDSAINIRAGYCRETQYIFKQVFEDTVSQKNIFDTVALPLVKGLIKGQNGLLFTYGVTGSGKTYTMTGTPQDGGIMPRTLDVLFNSISNFQAKKFVFKPDRLNGFEVQSESDANMDCAGELQAHILSKTPRLLRKKDSDPELNMRIVDDTKLSCVAEDNMFAVFVSYIEIYNNCVYDLLEDIPCEDGRVRNLQSKIVREDGSHNMYVHGVNEVEVKSTEEAFEEFYKGQRRKRMAHNTLNAESSRSHCIFSIRLVQAPLDMYGENILREKKCISISQLSLVDLAGSERTNRTKNVGQRLKEAGKINNSLMTLRTCLEVLRENQLTKANKMIPYRDSRLTHLFKNYFDGEGLIHMIICVNPRSDDYDENMHVMKFAEMSQEIQVSRPTPLRPLDNGMTPGRRRANQMYKQVVAKFEEAGTPSVRSISLESGVASVFSFARQFPNVELKDAHDDKLIKKLMEFLEDRMKRSAAVHEEFRQKASNFRQHTIDIDKELYLLNHQYSTLQAELQQSKEKISELENQLVNKELLNSSLQRRVIHYEKNIIPKLQEEVVDKECLISQQSQDKEKVKVRLQNKIAQTTEKMSRELDLKLSEQKRKYEMQMRNKEMKLRQVKQILTDDSAVNTPRSVTSSNSRFTPYQRSASSESIQTPLTAPVTPACDPIVKKKLQMGNKVMKLKEVKQILTNDSAMNSHSSVTSRNSKFTPCSVPSDNIKTPPITPAFGSLVNKKVTINTVAVSNPRHRRSRSVGNDLWLEHRPQAPVPLNTVLQPVMKKRKSVTKLTDVKDVVNSKTSKYCLMTQNQDSEGDLETNIFKGDVVPTCSGGAQVIFSDVEILKQKSPNSSPTRKRNAENQDPCNNVEDKCKISIEGHAKRSRR